MRFTKRAMSSLPDLISAAGSSREQAATALKFKGIPCVIAGSFSETYKRNAFNNGFVVFECPELVTHLRDTLTDRAPTTVGPEITIDYAKSILDRRRKIIPLPAAQSRGAGIDRRRRRRKARGVASPRESVICSHSAYAVHWRHSEAATACAILSERRSRDLPEPGPNC